MREASARRRALLGWVVVAGLAACRSPVAPPTWLSYPCAPDAGDAQCPASERCGLDGTCHLRGQPAPYACVTDADCELDWRCGLEKTCHSPDVAVPYLCARDSDCELYWRCGLDGHCHSPDVAKPYACTDDSSCELGWRCGLDGVCHDPSVAAPYVCRSDSDCGGGWRCGLDGQCLDASLDALRSDVFTDPLIAERVSPAAPDGYPDLVASSCGSYSIVRDGVMTRVDLHYGGVQLDDGGLEYAHVIQVPLVGRDVRALANACLQTTVLDDLGVLQLSAYQYDGGVGTRTDAGIGASRIRGTDLLSADERLSLVGVRTIPWPDAGGRQQLYDEASNLGGYLAAEGGLYTTSGQPVPLPAFSSVSCSDEDGGAGPRYRAVRMDLSQSNLAIEARPLDPNGHLAQAPPVLFFSNGLGAGCGWSYNRVTPPCQPCPSGWRLLDFVPGINTIGRVWCEPPDGGSLDDFILVPQNACGRLDLSAEVRVDRPAGRVGHTQYGVSTLAGQHGEIYEFGSSLMESYIFDRPATFYLRAGVPAALSSLAVYRYQAGLGLVQGPTYSNTEPYAVVDGQLSWGRISESLYDFSPDSGPVSLGAVAESATSISLPMPLPDGGTLVLYTDGPQVFTAEIAQPRARVLVPEPYVPITSITTVAPPDSPDGGRLRMAGYLLTNNALHAFSQRHDGVWSSSVVDVPENEWVEVWGDGPRGRIGYRDGTIYSLPSRVPIAPPLPSGQSVADFTQLCGVVFALGERGLYRLEAGDAGPVGQWVQQSLDAALSPALEHRLSKGKLLRDHDTLYLLTGYGTVVRLHAQGCP
jgi:hypothetical protein